MKTATHGDCFRHCFTLVFFALRRSHQISTACRRILLITSCRISGSFFARRTPVQITPPPSVGGFGATLEKEQSDSPISPYTSRTTLDNERHWTLLDFEAGSIVRSIKYLHGWVQMARTPLSIISYRKALASFSRTSERRKTAHVQRWLESFDGVPIHTGVPKRKILPTVMPPSFPVSPFHPLANTDMGPL